MPLHDYHCIACDKVSEIFTKPGSATPPICPACGGTRLEKLVSAPAPPPQSLALRKRFRARAAAEGHLSNFSQKEINTFKS